MGFAHVETHLLGMETIFPIYVFWIEPSERDFAHAETHLLAKDTIQELRPLRQALLSKR